MSSIPPPTAPAATEPDPNAPDPTAPDPTAPDPTAPDLAYEGRTPFVAYTEADVLHGLIHTNTSEPLEANFVITTQIMELHFELLRREWQLAIERLRADDPRDAAVVLNRSGAAQNSLLASWGMLEQMSPVQYNRFRGALGKASGFQSFGYREIEFLLGAKDEHMLRPHVGMPDILARLTAIFEAPSLYDEALALLARRGLPVPIDVLARSPREAYPDADPRVTEAWRTVYADTGADGRDLAKSAQLADLTELAEALTGVAERHTRWRFVHYMAVQRILGAKPGTGGSAGLAWLKRAADTMVFPELWQVRGVL
jgi:tryptophan 2,3-dioxygenase